MLVGDLRGRARHGGVDEGVAVTVPADPGAEPHEGWDGGCGAAGVIAEQPVVEVAVDGGNCLEQGLVEDAHNGADLVQRGGLVGAELGGAPEGVHLGEEEAAVVGEGGVAEAGVVAFGHEDGDAADRGRDRAAARLRGVGREHGVELEGVEAAFGFLWAEFGGELRERGREGGLGAGLEGLVSAAQGPHPVVLLGEIHQVEVAGERAGHLLGALVGEGLDESLRLGEGGGGVGGGGVDGEGAEALDVLEQVRAARFGEDLAEEFAEQAHVRAQGFRHLVPRLVAGGVRGAGGGGRRGRGGGGRRRERGSVVGRGGVGSGGVGRGGGEIRHG